jgi:hypothetical protein
MPIKLNKMLPGQIELEPIPVVEIAALRAKYAATSTIPPNDATSGWVSRAEIDALLKDNESPGKIPNGIRLYYGRHDKSTMDALGNEYINKHTVILVATYDPNEANPQTETSKDLLNFTGPNVSSVSYNSSYTGMGGDTIPLCPPRC